MGFTSGLALLLFRIAAPAGSAAAVYQAHDTFPFVPLLKIKSMSASAATIVPYEPTVPGQQTSHYTVAAHSAYGWFSPWQVRPHMSHLLLTSVVQERKCAQVASCVYMLCFRACRKRHGRKTSKWLCCLRHVLTKSERTSHLFKLVLV